jgi:hypothetical protein
MSILGDRESSLGAHLRLAILVTLLTAGGWPRAAEAQSSSSPTPEFTGAKVYVSGVPDEYGPLREDIARLERSAPQTYYVVVVRSTGSGRKSTRTYLERMVDQWESQARRRGIPFDKQRSVIILLAIENRQIIVLGGEELQERLGFRDPYVERDLIQPHFLSYARSKDYLQGLRVLVAQTDRWITEHDQNLARRGEEAAARDARLKGDARSTLDSAKQLLEETRKELDTRKAAGLQVGPLEARLRKAASDLDDASRRLDASASEALDLGQRSQRELLGVMDKLRQISAQQAETDAALGKAAGLSGEVLKAVEQAGRDGLPVAPVQEELDAANAQIEQARQALKSDPEKAERLAAQADQGLRAALDHTMQLPELRHQAEQKVQAIATLEQSTKTELDRALRAGASVADLEIAWEQASRSLNAARTSAGADDRKALASFKEAETVLTDVRGKARTRFDQHRFYTRILPLTVLGLIALGVLSVLGLLWLRKRHLQAKVNQQFKGFREKAVALMDKLDALRNRHKSLPATDPDFTQPLAGATLTLYNDVEKDLNGLWERWLRVMDVWEQAQKLVRAGSGLAIVKTAEAKKLIEQEGDFEELRRKCSSCEERLDRLNHAHENARETLKSARDEVAKLRKTLEEITAAQLPIEPYTKEITIVEGLLTQAEGLLPADPIGASEVIAHSREVLKVTADCSGQVLARFADARSVLTGINQVAAQTTELRSQGLKLTEDQADPDPRLDEARRRHSLAMEALKQANPAAASKQIDEARSRIDQARQGIDRHLQAQDAVRKELPARREAARALGQASDQTAAVLEELRRGFAPESWSDVADHLDEARAMLRSMEQKLARADHDASDGVQNYLRAASTLAEIARDQARVDQLLRAVADRRNELTTLARQSRDLAAGLGDEVNRAETFIRQNDRAIGPEVRRSLDHTEQAYRDLISLQNQPLPNWPEIRKRIDVVRQGAAVTIRRGQEDVEGFRRVSQKIGQVRQKAQEVGALLRQEDKDRPPANQRYRAAVDALAQLDGGNTAPGDWDRLLKRLGEIEGNLDRADALAHEDISLANGAIAEISEADRAIRSARAFYESGVTVDVSEAEARITRARGALATQSYEQAIELANAAERAANDAQQSASHEARLRQMRFERGQIFVGADPGILIAAAQAASEAAGRWASSGGFGIPMPPSLPSFPDSDVSTGSWGGGSDQGSWTEGADQAGW